MHAKDENKKRGGGGDGAAERVYSLEKLEGRFINLPGLAVCSCGWPWKEGIVYGQSKPGEKRKCAHSTPSQYKKFFSKNAAHNLQQQIFSKEAGNLFRHLRITPC